MRLRAVESPNITAMEPEPPIFWSAAQGANVRDVDNNVFIDLTAGFGVATAGHANEKVVAAISQQAAQLAHALGDVQPAEIKVRLLERLAEILPEPLQVTVLASSGAEAVEAALKTARMRTGRSGILAFRNAYHGLTYGALATTHRSHFRANFTEQLFAGVHFASFASEPQMERAALEEIDAILADHEIGAIIVEPIQGRGGIVVPTDTFLGELRARCDGKTRVLIFDEVYTGCGRTGRWLACEHWHVVPDLVVLGKALSGALPLSACVGSSAVMSAWPPSKGEAIHTSTFLGNPIACAGALAQLDEIATLLERAHGLGLKIQDYARSAGWSVRGLGLIQGIVLENRDGSPDPEGARAVVTACLNAGVILLSEAPRANVLAITPPASITDEQLAFALSTIEASMSAAR